VNPEISRSEEFHIKDLDPHFGNKKDPVTFYERLNKKQPAIVIPENIYGALKQVAACILAEPGPGILFVGGGQGISLKIIEKRQGTAAENQDKKAT
jgi:hypothetical protein